MPDARITPTAGSTPSKSSPAPIIILEPHRAGTNPLSPLTDLRPACCVRTGAWTLLQRLQHREATTGDIRVLGIACPPHRAALFADVARVPINRFDDWESLAPSAIVLQGSIVLPEPELLALEPNHALIDEATGEVLAQHMPTRSLPALLEGQAPCTSHATRTLAIRSLRWPWHVRTHRDAALASDLALLTKDGQGAIPRMSQLPGVTLIADCAAGRCAFMHPTAKVSPATIFDCDLGPIVLDEHSTIRPGAILIGPCYVGRNSTILERATIRPGTAVGPSCKVNGEVGGTILQGFANKAHDGYLGDSWLGEWVNLGAGTTNSNLLNTYGEVIAKQSAATGNQRTGEQFLGAIIADHVKTAICTRIMTGSVLHLGSMFATTAAVSGCVEGWTWATDSGHKPYRFDKFLDVAKAAMARRKVEPSPAYIEALQSLAQALGRA